MVKLLKCSLSIFQFSRTSRDGRNGGSKLVFDLTLRFMFKQSFYDLPSFGQFLVFSRGQKRAEKLSLGYALTYTELPDWGHALTHRLNEQIVLPWFEALN